MKKIIFWCLISLIQSSFALEKLSVVLDWFPNPDHAPLIIASQQGYFKEQGLDVKLIGPSDPTDPPKWVASNKAEIGITYEPEFMQQVDAGLPLVRIGTLIDRPLDCIVALKESGIKRIADLKGKRIGTGSSGLNGVMLSVVLNRAGLSQKDVKLINVRYGLTQALLSHQVDAVTGMMRNFEVPLIELAGKKVVTFFPEEYGIPNYSVLIFVTHKKLMQDKRLPRFLTAIKKAVRYLDEHPKDAWRGFIRQYPEANNKVNREAWFATLPYFAEDPSIFNPKEWERFALFMQQQQLIKEMKPTSEYAVILT